MSDAIRSLTFEGLIALARKTAQTLPPSVEAVVTELVVRAQETSEMLCDTEDDLAVVSAERDELRGVVSGARLVRGRASSEVWPGRERGGGYGPERSAGGRTMSTEELDAIEARATAATAGPWTYEGSGCIHTRATEHYDPEDEAYVLEVLRGPDDPSRHTANGRFVAAARTDVPALVAEVRRLRTEVERLQRTAQEGGR